jgi:Carboxypeptidase regulatory-like domain
MWITGQVIDDRGEVLSGVSVEAYGPAHIHRRSVISNIEGQYVLRDLPPGVYTITFSLPGYSTLKRAAIDLSGYVATINAQLQSRRMT